MRRRVAEVAHFFGIEPWFRRSVAELSGGQKQMTTLAGTLAMQPRLLLLDEPTAQLDPVAEKNFLHALFRVNRELGITVVVATHAPEAMAEYATDMVELREGTLIRCFEPRAGVSAFRRSESVPVAPASAQDDEAAYAVLVARHPSALRTRCRLGSARLRSARHRRRHPRRRRRQRLAASPRCCVPSPGSSSGARPR